MKRKDIEYEPRDKAFLRVSPWKGILRFGKKGKLAPRYIGPYEVIERIGPVAYRLALPPELSQIHSVFHVSQLRRYRSNPSHILQQQSIELQPDLTYEEAPSQILGREVRQLRNRQIPMVKIQWTRHTPEEATWEVESAMRSKYPHLFPPGMSIA